MVVITYNNHMKKERQAADFSSNINKIALDDLVLLDQQSLRAAEQFLEQGTPPNTARSYQAAFRYLQAWSLQRLGHDLTAEPMSVEGAIQFVLDHLPRRDDERVLALELPAALDERLVAMGVKRNPGALKTNTVIHRLSVLGKFHKLQGWDSPTDDVRYRTLLRSARNTQVHEGERVLKKTAATADPLQAMLATCQDDGLRGLRDRALLLVAWSSGGRRRAELAQIQLADLMRQSSGDYLLTLGLGKTERDGSTRGKPVRGQAAQALDAWLAASGISSGPVFVRLLRNGQPGRQALSGNHIALIVKRRAALAGLQGDWAAHSLRSGFITEAGRQNMAIPDVMAMTDHRSVTTLMGYYQAGELLRAPVSELLEAAPHPAPGPVDSIA